MVCEIGDREMDGEMDGRIDGELDGWRRDGDT